MNTDSPPDKSGPQPDWDSFGPLISSTDVARLFQVLPKTLSKYAQRGIIAPPVERGTNHALYRKEDVQRLWQLREYRKAQGYIKARDFEKAGGDEGGMGGGGPADTPGTGQAGQLTAAPAFDPEAMRAALSGAVAEGVREGNEELRQELAALREEIAALRALSEIGRAQGETPDTTGGIQPPTKTWWERLTGRG